MPDFKPFIQQIVTETLHAGNSSGCWEYNKEKNKVPVLMEFIFLWDSRYIDNELKIKKYL